MFGYTPLAGRATRWIIFCVPTMLFQSTPLAGGATVVGGYPMIAERISIHAPRGRGDSVLRCAFPSRAQFQSTPLAGGATDLL